MSNETKWTPGPWMADIRSGCLAVYPVDREYDSPGLGCDQDRVIHYSTRDAEYNGQHWDMSREAQYNAHLIAAAPELYSVLETAVMQAERMLNGEPPEEGEDFDGWFLSAKAALAKARGES